jgi:hypothetical protein
MAATAVKLRREPQLKTFYATVLVTRTEQWCVEAASAEEAHALLSSGAGHRCGLGDCVQIEVERLD